MVWSCQSQAPLSRIGGRILPLESRVTLALALITFNYNYSAHKPQVHLTRSPQTKLVPAWFSFIYYLPEFFTPHLFFHIFFSLSVPNHKVFRSFYQWCCYKPSQLSPQSICIRLFSPLLFYLFFHAFQVYFLNCHLLRPSFFPRFPILFFPFVFLVLKMLHHFFLNSSVGRLHN